MAVQSNNGAVGKKNLLEQEDDAKKKFGAEPRRVVKKGHRRRITALAWNITGQYLASAGMDNFIGITGFEDFYTKSSSSSSAASGGNSNSGGGVMGGLNFAYWLQNGHQSGVTCLDWHPLSADVLASGGDDNLVVLWDMKHARTAKENPNRKMNQAFHIIKTGNPLKCVRWSNDGSKIAISDRSHTVTLVNSDRYEEICKKSMHTSVLDLQWTHDNRFIICATDEGTIDILEVATMTIRHSFLTQSGACKCLRLSDRYIVTGGHDSVVSVWDYDTLTCVKGLNHFKATVNDVAFSADFNLIASVSDDDYTEITFIPTWQSVGKVTMPETELKKRATDEVKLKVKYEECRTAVAWHPKYMVLAYARTVIREPEVKRQENNPRMDRTSSEINFEVVINTW